VVTKAVLGDPKDGAAEGLGRPGGVQRRELSTALARGVLVDALFRQLVTTGRIGNPMRDAMGSLEVDDGQRPVANFVRGLSPHERDALAEDVARHAARLRAHWPSLSPTWLPRTGDRISIPLAGGRLVLTGVLDLVIGAPSTGRASVCIVELKSGGRHAVHRDDLHFYALLETLRSGALPFRVATYYSLDGHVDAEDMTDELLAAAVRRTIEGATARFGPGDAAAAC
jgi:hypothetical protein